MDQSLSPPVFSSSHFSSPFAIRPFLSSQGLMASQHPAHPVHTIHPPTPAHVAAHVAAHVPSMRFLSLSISSPLLQFLTSEPEMVGGAQSMLTSQALPSPAILSTSESAVVPAAAAVGSAAATAATASAAASDVASKREPPPPSQGKQRGPKLFLAGGLAGATARTCTAPLDRIKLLLQVQHLGQLGTKAGAYTGVVQAAVKIAREEGVLAFWKGNMLNVIRVFPYSAAQFTSHEHYKQVLAGKEGKLTLPQRLAAGALAGMTATALTHPLDTVRLRLAMPVSGYNGPADAFITIVRKEGFGALYKGLFPTLLGIAPYAALNFASYDLFKAALYKSGRVKEGVVNNLLMGAAAGTVATTICYPLDTVRRRMQMKGKVYNSTLDAFTTMLRTEGLKGFYRGWWANTLKVVPQNSIRFVTYEFCKSLLGITKTKTDT